MRLTSREEFALKVLVEVAHNKNDLHESFAIVEVGGHPRGYVITPLPEGIELLLEDLEGLDNKELLEHGIARGHKYFRITKAGFGYYDRYLKPQ